MSEYRRQVSLYVPAPESLAFERVRRVADPIQFALIPAHVTACREDEVADWDLLTERLAKLTSISITISFGAPTPLGAGWLLPTEGETLEFDSFRQYLLQGFAPCTRKHHAHITLLHPRNAIPNSPDFEDVAKFDFPKTVLFSRASLIQQVDGGPWRELAVYPS